MSDNLFPDVSAFLRDRGWSLVRENTSGADLWSLADRVQMYLPHVITRGSFEWSDITERIAFAHDERPSTVAREIDFVRYDVARFRVDNADRTISLESGATVVSSAFGMLRAAATSARRPRQSIGSNYSKLGDGIAREARLGHTEPGSFVFPVALKVSTTEQETLGSLPGTVFDTATPESPERRVTRTLAQAISALDKYVLKPGLEPRMRDLTPVVIAGGTKELLAHLTRTVADPDISWLETGFSWAPIEAVSPSVPKAVTVPADAEARELMSRAVRLLSSPKTDPLRVVTGPIIHIGHTPGDPFGEVGIQSPSPSGSRYGRVEVTVRQEQLSQIHHWMDQGTTVVVYGVVEHRPGRPARLKNPAELQALEDTLPGT